MPIFQKDGFRFLFIHIPKAGGTSIEQFFLRNEWHISFLDRGGEGSLNKIMKCSPQHLHSDILAKIFRLNSFGLIFMTVRDPIHRIESEFRWRRKFSTRDTTCSYEDWVIGSLAKFEDDAFLYDNHIRPQSQFELPETEVFKLEDGLHNIPRFIEERLDVSFANKTVQRLFSTDDIAVKNEEFILSDSARNILRDFYRRDFERFNY